VHVWGGGGGGRGGGERLTWMSGGVWVSCLCVTLCTLDGICQQVRLA
jgi:hypothetical protein